MSINGFPDMLRTARLGRLQTQAKSALLDASYEMTTGLAADQIKATKGDPMKLFGLNATVSKLESRAPLMTFAKGRADATATALSQIDEAVGALGADLLSFAETGDVTNADRIAKGALSALSQTFNALGSSMGARMLFSGEKTGQAPLADMQVLLDDVAKALTPSDAPGLITEATYVAANRFQPAPTLPPAPPPTPLPPPTPEQVRDRAMSQLDLYFSAPPADGLTPTDYLNSYVSSPTPDPVQDPLDAAAAFKAERFSLNVYQGGQKSPPTVELGDLESLDYTVKADNPALKSVIRQLATIASVATTPGLNNEEKLALYKESGLGLIKAHDELTGLRADLGLSQRRIDDAIASNAAERTALDLARSDLVGVDKYKAATRVQDLEHQLQAIYTVTARTAQLSFMDYMR